MINLLLVGLGPHAKRIYYPIAETSGLKNNFRIVHAIDLESKKEDISSYFRVNGYTPIDITYFSDNQKSYNKLKPEVCSILDKIVETKKITGVIISTEPLSHTSYAEWALSRGLSILMDKPVSIRENVVNSLEAVEGILDDYNILEKAYVKAQAKNPHIVFSLMAQRRFHPAFIKIKELIKEVFNETNCPITSIQSFHSDGQWRMPSEIVDQVYHPYCQGYGKCSHSGYHSIDIAPWLIEATESKGKEINNVEVFSNFLYPNDFLTQLSLKDYSNLFTDFDQTNKYNTNELVEKFRAYGEIDAFLSFKFKHGDKTLSLGSTNLIHNGFAQRNWTSTLGRDLYKGNGRVRHEGHYIEQGPFQSISYLSYQGNEIDPDNLDGVYDIGGEYHLDIHVFRNQKMFPKWKNYEKITINEIGVNIMEGKSRGHQEDARRTCFLEFVLALQDSKNKVSSDFLDHKRSTLLLYAAYKSAVLRKIGKNPVVNITF